MRFHFILWMFSFLCSCDRIISGQGSWKYEYQSDLLQLPESATGMQDGHGLAVVGENLYFTYHAVKVEETTQALVRFDIDGTNAKMLGKTGIEGLSYGTPHGLTAEFDPKKNETFLYHANNGRMVWKTNLNGDIIWSVNFTNWQTDHPEYWPIIPTDAVAIPNTNILLLTDGYGSSFLHWLNKYTGEYLNYSFGGKGKSSSNPVKFTTPHNINVDAFDPSKIVVTDRSNHRLVWIDYKGNYMSETPIMDTGMTFPCDVNYYRDSQDGNMYVVPSLGDQAPGTYVNGSVAIYNDKNEMVSRIEVAKLLGKEGHQHPHDAVFLPNGDVAVCCWSGPSAGKEFGPAKGKISYWKRI